MSLLGLVTVSVFLSTPLFASAASNDKTVPLSIPEQIIKSAATSASGVPNPLVSQPAEAVSKTVDDVHNNVISPVIQAIIATLSFDAISYLVDTMAYNTAVWLATGADGQTPLVEIFTGKEAWNTFGLDVAANAIGSLSEEISDYYDVEFNLCAPPDPMLRLSLQLGIVGMYDPPKPKCDWQQISTNWSSFYQSAVETAEDPSKYMLEKFAESLEPGQSTLSYVVGVNMTVQGEVAETKGVLFEEYLAKNGIKDVVDVVTGKVKTPATLVESTVNSKFSQADDTKTSALYDIMSDSSIWSKVGMSALSIFTNTLLSTWFDEIQTGILKGITYEEIDLSEGIGGSTSWDRGAAEEFYSGLVSTTKLSLDSYSVLTEFVTCPASSTMTRQINNCVMDANFLQAVSRTTVTETMTVSQAINDGLLHGEWPLYRSDDLRHNQDPLCYTYGYCYGNLVKMRKARIIPIGWELAAASEQNSGGSPITLQEVVDGFNYCNSDDKADAEHPWCHLIDPNWVLKYPSQQCLASMIGEQTLTTMISGRSGACVDSPSCLSQGADGSCEGYGYCTREMNTWNFNGDSCPAEYAGCLSFTNADTSAAGTWLFNTLDQGLCSASSAGCMWYRTNKYFDDAGTADASDDSYEWLPGDEVYVADGRANDVLAFSAGVSTPRVTYSYDTSNDGTADYSYDTYSYEDRIYFNADVQSCSAASVGCSEVYPVGDEVSLNVIRNPGFEDDEDDNGVADYWEARLSASSDYDEEGSNSYSGTDSYHLLDSTSDLLTQSGIPLQQGTFYTISVFAKGDTAADDGVITLDLVASDNSAVDLAGYSSDCTIATDSVTLSLSNADNEEMESFDCTFTTPILDDERLFIIAGLSIEPTSGGLYVDAIQLEAKTSPSSFHEGYNSGTETAKYLQLAPDWLGCSGDENDSAACRDYAASCSATDAGCSLYTPVDGDPAVPAILADGDECPAECVGYTTYAQEDTAYDTGEFPLYFIADTAEACGSSEVGCDEFTNLETEQVEVYSYLRACVTSEMADDEAEAVYFTWEGSDQTGYQLVSYQLLKSNLSSSATINYSETSGVDDTAAGDAPCTNWEVTSESTLECQDNSATLAALNECNEHADILTEPDCREFYDESGDIHYRLYSETVSISDDCTAYRKTDANETDCDASGGYFTASGECRYFVEPNESTACSAAAAGCREYTGGSSRNSSVIFNDYFEEGSYDNWEIFDGSPALSVSNESVAVDGHSLRVVAGSSSDAFQVLHDVSATGSTCTDEAGCESTDGVCTVDYSETYCGVLVDELTAGKTFVVSFWAKGTGSLTASLVEGGGAGDVHNFDDAVELTTGWQLFELGPLDTSGSDYSSFDENAVLTFFASDEDQIFYIDNVQLEQTEENLTLIKDSWVTPSTCDETPDGAPSDQYYLGCEEYTDQNDQTLYLYQFSDLCSEEVVGCEAIYDTQNSASPYTEYYNLSCYTDSGAAAVSATVCHFDQNMDGADEADEEVCTIVAGYTNCQFDYDGNLPVPLPNNIKLGPEAVYVPADEVKYAVVDQSFTCEADNMGCIEVGKPTFSQDRTVVESFTSTYVLNQPDNYGAIQCSNDELFCAEWASTKDGNYYFKDPGEQDCEYKSGVTIGSGTYDGWFRSGTTDFCYGSGFCSEKVAGADVACNEDSDCASVGAGTCEFQDGSYIVNGNYSGIWYNGDNDYAGWAAVCDGYDLCTEFLDPLATQEEASTEGTSFFYLNNESLDEKSLAASARCDGQVSLLDGCVLFDNRLDQELAYAASPSYLVSLHADLFFGDTPNSLQDPVSCDNPAIDGEYTLTTGDEVNICQQRCAYEVASGHSIDNLSVDQGPSSADTNMFFGGACIYDSDCQLGRDSLTNADVEGSCFDLDIDSDGSVETNEMIFGAAADLSGYVIQNDTNNVLKVYRDRECSEWLACSSSYAAWDERTSQWTDVCEEVGLCDQYDAAGTEGGTCTSWVDESATVLDLDEYSGRNTSWYGLDYSGYAIPDQLPAQYYEQIDLGGYCTNTDGEIAINGDEAVIINCSSDSDCTTVFATRCTNFEDLSSNDISNYDLAGGYYLAYLASSCEEASGDNCTVGFCTDTGEPCSDNDQCPGAECTVGYCEDASTTDCSSDANCTDPDYSECKNGICTNVTTETCINDSECTPGSCVPGALALTGTCYNNACLVGLDGQPFSVSNSEEKGCRGYPETLSPFPNSIVNSWINPGPDSEPLTSGTYNLDVKPYDFVYGFNDANVCSPLSTGTVGDYFTAADDCNCSYEKTTYGEDSAYRYYPLDTGKDEMLDGVCIGGSKPGAQCDSDDDCKVGDCTNENTADTSCSGTCQLLSKNETLFGWDGYCIERDTSVQLFGSSDDADRACLTWLPIDQLAGSRDMYANNTEAGYEGGNLFYCAEVDVAYNIGTTGLGCAESYNGVCNDGDWDVFVEKVFSDGDCAGSIACQDGSFAVMGGCGNLVDDVDSTPGDGTFSCDEPGDNDCPFFCVPKASYKTEKDSLGEIGDKCLPPGNISAVSLKKVADTELDDGSFLASLIKNKSDGGDREVELADDQDFYIYLVAKIDDAYEYYNDCVTRGVYDSLENFIYPYQTVDEIPESEAGSKGFSGLTTNIGSYAACTSVVQVSQEAPDDNGEFNKAWTNRVWNGNPGLYSLEGSDSDYLGYTPDTLQTIFGKALDIDTVNGYPDPYPDRIAVCTDVEPTGLDDYDYLITTPTTVENLNADGTTCSDSDLDPSDLTGLEAMPYATISGVSSSTAGWIDHDGTLGSYCSDLDSDSDCECSSDAECNNGVLCTAGLCDGGENNGAECDDVTDCYFATCDYHRVGRSGSLQCNVAKPFSLSLSVGDFSDAQGLLKQIFAESYGLYEFKDQYNTIGASTSGQGITLEWEEKGEFSEVTSFEEGQGDWIWDDVAAEGDIYGDTRANKGTTDAPTIASVGRCYGTNCQEGKENKFTVNNSDEESLEGNEGSFHASVKFFAWADSNQMPIRNVIVDWGDGDREMPYENYPWPLSSQTGSDGDSSYYKNHRGLDSDEDPLCGTADEWGFNTGACQTAYFSFENDYYCSSDIVINLETAGYLCDVEESTGRLINSPCTGGEVSGAEGKCVFQPRVHVKDNWGWCTGYCNYNDEESSSSCFGVNECDSEYCPGGASSVDGGNCRDTESKIINPWINYDGVIVLDWQE